MEYPFNLKAAESLSSNIRFGTSSWTYPGWKNLIYSDSYKSDKDFRARSLGEYFKCPLFRTVGIDSTFYSAPALATLNRYAELTPENFSWVSKVWERITIPKYPAHKRYGEFAGKGNPDFLNPALFTDKIASVYTESESVKKRTGPFVFQFGSISKSVMSSAEFFEKLLQFLRALPEEFQYATEIRNRDFLTNDYFNILNETGATHCFNHWNYMPTLKKQMIAAAEAGGLKAPFYVARILTPRGISYSDAVKRFKPYDSIKEPNEEMRKDVVRLAKRAIERTVAAYVIVNNRAEGNSPMTINSIIQMIH